MRKVRSLSAIAVAVITIAVWCASIARAQTSDPPHVLLIMSDDHAWPLYSFMYANDYKYIDQNGDENLRPLAFPTPSGGDPIPMTPNLDRLADRGVVFPHGYSADSVCVPSFATTQSGLNRKDNDVLHKSWFPKKIDGRKVGGIGDYIAHIKYPSLPSYDSLAFGKSWNSYNPLGFTCAQSGADPKCVAHKKGHYRFEGLLDQIVGSLQKDPQQRWFAFYSPHLPHADFDGKTLVDSGVVECASPEIDGLLELPTKYFNREMLCDRLADLQARMEAMETCFGSDQFDCPSYPTACNGWDDPCQDGYRYLRFKKIYRDLVSTIMLEDFWIGLLLDFLENNASILKNSCDPGDDCAGNWACCLPGVSHNTLILYQTDNGMIPDEALAPGVPSRGWKKSVGENGFRTPILLSLPRVFDAGPKFKNDLVHAIDMIPTMLDFATNSPIPTCGPTEKPRPPRWNSTPTPGGPDPTPTPGGPTPTPGWVAANKTPRRADPACLEGISLRPALSANDTPSNAKRKYLFAQKGSKIFLRTQDGYRLFRKGCASNKFKLYHLPSDMDENCELLAGPCPLSTPPPTPHPGCLCEWEQQLNLWYSSTKPCTALSPGACAGPQTCP